MLSSTGTPTPSNDEKSTLSEFKRLKKSARTGGLGRGTITTHTPIIMEEPLLAEYFIFISVNIDTNAAFITQEEGTYSLYFKQQNGHPLYQNLRSYFERFLAESGEKIGLFVTSSTTDDNKALIDRLAYHKGLGLATDRLTLLEPLRITTTSDWDILYNPETRSIYIMNSQKELSKHDAFPPKDDARLSKYATLIPLEEKIRDEKQQAENVSRILKQFEDNLQKREVEAIKNSFTNSDSATLTSTVNPFSDLASHEGLPRIFLLFEHRGYLGESIDYETDKKIAEIITYCQQNIAPNDDDTLKCCIKAYDVLATGIFEKALKENKNVDHAWLGIAKSCVEKAEHSLTLLSDDFKKSPHGIFEKLEKKLQTLNETLNKITTQLAPTSPVSIIAARGSVYSAATNSIDSINCAPITSYQVKQQ